MIRKILFLSLWFFPGILFSQVNTDLVLTIGRNALYFEDYVLSIQYFNRVINAKPYLAEPYYFRAVAKYNLDDMKGAEDDCTKAIEINPFMVNVYNLRGIVKQRQKDYKAALDDFTAGLKVEPENLNLLMNRGIAYINQKKYDEAIEDYLNVLKYDKRQTGAYLNMGVAYIQKGDTLKALESFNKVVEINPYMPEGYAYRAMLQYQTKDYKLALADYDKAVKLRPNDASYYMNRAVVRYQLDDLRGTFDDIDKVIEMEPRSTLAYSNRGILRAQVGDINRAIDDFSKVLALEPNDMMTHYSRGLLYYETGELYKALDDLNMVVDEYPEFGPVYYYRSLVKEKLNDMQGAQRDYMTAYKLDQDRKAQGLKADLDEDNKRPKDDKKGDKNNDKKSEKEKETRRNTDRDLRKHNQMAMFDDFDEADMEVEKNETIRGRIQNRDIIIDLEPMFGLSFYTGDTILPKAKYYEPAVEKFNSKKVYDKNLRLTNRELESDGGSSAYFFDKIRYVSEEILLDPNETELHFVRGVLYGIVLNYNSAISEYDVCVKRGNSKVIALFSRAYTRYKMVEAIRSIEQSKPVNPVDISINLGSNKPKQQEQTISTIVDYDLIIDDLNNVVENDPDFEFAYYNLGIIYCHKRDFKRAEEMFNKAISINADFSEAYFNRGLVRLYLEKETEGTADLSKAGELGIFKAYNVIKRFGSNEVETSGED